MWHSGPRGSTRRLRGDVTLIYIYIYMWVIVHIVFRLSEENYYPSKPSHNINPIPFFNFSHVGLSSTRSLNVHVTWRKEKRRIGWSVDHRASIAWTRGSPIAIKNTCFNKGIITVLIKSHATHLDRQIAIQGAKTHAFYNASHQASSGPPFKIGRLRLIWNGPRWTVPS